MGKGVEEKGIVFQPRFGEEMGGEKVSTSLNGGGRGIEKGGREKGGGIVFGEAIEDATVPFGENISVVGNAVREMTKHRIIK